ncbi:NAD(P)H-binding protein [Mannheimia granulomatis]|uniref:NAD(P)H-binding protein n=1 Tax=Mannheimia granulomatis TaxID=85402 RepID=UPI00067B752D|nr:NAD(P)H-binding protein [Mannheimia granulomatis]
MNNQKPTVLVLGATGTVGSQVVKVLEQSSAVNVRIPSRNPDTVAKLKSEGKDAVYMDLDKPQTFALALGRGGASAAFDRLHGSNACPKQNAGGRSQKSRG